MRAVLGVVALALSACGPGFVGTADGGSPSDNPNVRACEELLEEWHALPCVDDDDEYPRLESCDVYEGCADDLSYEWECAKDSWRCGADGKPRFDAGICEPIPSDFDTGEPLCQVE